MAAGRGRPNRLTDPSTAQPDCHSEPRVHRLCSCFRFRSAQQDCHKALRVHRLCNRPLPRPLQNPQPLPEVEKMRNSARLTCTRMPVRSCLRERHNSSGRVRGASLVLRRTRRRLRRSLSSPPLESVLNLSRERPFTKKAPFFWLSARYTLRATHARHPIQHPAHLPLHPFFPDLTAAELGAECGAESVLDSTSKTTSLNLYGDPLFALSVPLILLEWNQHT